MLEGGNSTGLDMVLGEVAEASNEAETDPLLDCNLIVKDEAETYNDIYIKSEPAD